MSIKLDMSKAYNRVKWNYLRKVMSVMGFKPNMIELIMKCVSLTSFSILINEISKGHIILVEV